MSNLYSKLISVGEDSIMNVYRIETVNGSKKALKSIAKVDLDDEVYAIASNSQDQIALGG